MREFSTIISVTEAKSPEDYRRHLEEVLKIQYNFIEDIWVREKSTTIRFRGEKTNVDYVHDIYTVLWINNINRPKQERTFTFSADGKVISQQYDPHPHNERTIMKNLNLSDPVYRIEPVPFSESEAKGCVRLWLGNEFIGNFWNESDAHKEVDKRNANEHFPAWTEDDFNVGKED